MKEFFYDNWTVFPAFVLSGVLIGILYDVFRIFRVARTYDPIPEGKFLKKIAPPKKAPRSVFNSKFIRAADSVIVFAEDILFWTAAALIETVSVYYLNNGEIRLDFFFYTLAGFGAYMASIGKLVVFSAKKIIFLCRCLIFYVFYIIMYPIRKVCSALYKAARKLVYVIYDAYDKRRSENALDKLLEEAERGFGV